MKCLNCGEENKESEQVCKICGKELPGTLPGGVFLNQNVPTPDSGRPTNFPLQALGIKEVFRNLNTVSEAFIGVAIIIFLTVILGFIVLMIQ